MCTRVQMSYDAGNNVMSVAANGENIFKILTFGLIRVVMKFNSQPIGNSKNI